MLSDKQLLRKVSVRQSVCIVRQKCIGFLDVYTCHADVMHSILILFFTSVPIRRSV